MLLLILLAFILVPVLEIYVLIQVGQAIGFWPTAGLLAAQAVLGAWLIRREGRRAWGALYETVRTGVLRERELGDAVLVMAGGVLLLLPGFGTDVLGLALVLPFTRPLLRRALAAFAERRMRAAEVRAATIVPPPGYGGAGFDPFGRRPGAPEPVETPPGPVVRGEVIEDDDPKSRA
ncbi:FxsA family protein [Actinomadura sp. GC306]|uniref:FxsA family protein n=1 Tax=Actinomadura sp. GC306 TaxID=2530367 RepID=UPI001044BCEB|nr:FxsA family protein [Actinomadura sp. GC306]TDC61830.1 FxsA family protein [Actinomadura sp. GC306]